MTESDTLADDEPNMPEHWVALIKDVSRASLKKIGNPAHPRHEIGRFEAIGLRGRGSFGIVFEVYDPELDRNVALKLYQAPAPDMGQRVLDEARTLAKLSHPNVITVLEAGRHGDDLFFVMEYVKGETAHDFAHRKPPPTWQEILDVYLAIGAGLAAAHAAGIVHGDFKPGNVLLDADAKWPRVADFGLAQLEREIMPDDGDELEGTPRRGTLLYMAPEVLRGLGCDALSDQWSFCVSLWQTLEGLLPFVGVTTQDLLDEIEHAEPLCGDRDVPGPLRDVLRVGFSVDPSARYPDMDALLRALADVRSKLESVAVVPTSPPVQPRQGPGWGAFAISILVATAAVIGALGRWSQPVSRGAGVSLLVHGMNRPPASACVLADEDDPVNLHPVVEAVCQLIRVGELEDAISTWKREYDARLKENAGGKDVSLALDSLILGRTFVSQGVSFLLNGQYAAARDAANAAAFCATAAASTLDRGHGGVQLIMDRANLLLDAAQPQHSTTPLPSMPP